LRGSDAGGTRRASARVWQVAEEPELEHEFLLLGLAQTLFLDAAGEVPSQGTDLVSYSFEKRCGDGAVVALVDGRGGRELMYSELEATVRMVAAGLVEHLEVTKGDVLGILSPNSVEFEVLFLAAAFLGAVMSAQNPLNTPADVKKLFHSAGAAGASSLLFVSKKGGGDK
jgi:acyl-CoA synthetase (AMP-forming)/AMP-acid ligase II